MNIRTPVYIENGKMIDRTGFVVADFGSQQSSAVLTTLAESVNLVPALSAMLAVDRALWQILADASWLPLGLRMAVFDRIMTLDIETMKLGIKITRR